MKYQLCHFLSILLWVNRNLPEPQFSYVDKENGNTQSYYDN